MEYEPISALFQGFEDLLEARIRIKVKGRIRIRIRIRIKVTRRIRIRICIKVMWIRNIASNDRPLVIPPDAVSLRIL
jgi:hypothetical protein